MSNFTLVHLLAAIIYLSFAVLILLRNRNARHHQLFSFLMILFFVDSLGFLVMSSQENVQLLKRAFFLQGVIAELLIPPVFTWFVLVLAQKYRLLKNIFFFVSLFTLPVVLISYMLIEPEMYTLHVKSGYYGYMMWTSPLIRILVLLYIFFNGLLSMLIIIKFGLKNFDYRIRAISKTVAVAVLVIFGYSMLDHFQYILYKEKVVPDVFNLVALVGVSFILYSLVKQKIIVFSSSVLSENILEHLTSPVILLNEKGKIIYYNQILQDITSFRPGEITGVSIFKLLPDLDISLDELMSFGRFGIRHIRTVIKDAFGNDTRVILSVRALHNHKGDFEGLVCTLESMNKPSQGQYDSRNKDERLLNAFAASDKGFWDWDIEQGDLFFSEMACRILGYKPAELASLNFAKWREMLHYEHRDTYFETLNKHLRQESDSFYMEYRVRSKDGDWIWILDKGRITALDSNENPVRMSGVFTDITRVKTVESQLRKYKKKLEDTLKFKNRLIDLLSTDIREPFNTLIGVSQYISAEEVLPENKVLIDNLYAEANHAYQLIEEILSLAKIDDGRVKRHDTLFSVRDIVDKINENLSARLKAKHLRLVTKSNANLTLNTDSEILRRVLETLVNNAIKFSNENQAIDVYWERDNGEVVIIVRDYGVGMTLKEQRRLFKIDESFNNIGTKGESGHGLGLLIAQRLASIIDARITFKSSKDEGSEFTISLNSENPH